MQLVLGIFSFVFGAIIGSFLNVVILRHNTGLRKKRSVCYSCGHTLEPRELIPIFSYLFQRGRCLKCKSKISPQYFFVELTTGLLSVALLGLAQNIQTNLWPAYYFLSLIIFSLFICTFVYDLRHKIMPDSWTFLALLFSFILSIVFGKTLMSVLISSFLVSLPLLLINLLSRGRAMGFGDVKFGLVIGALLGISGGFSALLLAFWLGGLFSLYLIIRYPKKVTRKSEIAFGPFLILGTAIAFVFNVGLDTILLWFSRILS